MSGNILLDESKSKYCMFPIEDNQIWKFYKDSISLFWTSDEIDFKDDLKDFLSLSKNERHFIKYILAFFASADGVVNENLCMRFYNDVHLSEAKAVYGIQIFIETIHSETYSLLINEYIKNAEERNDCFNAIEKLPVIKKKMDWGLKWISDNESSFSKRLVAFAIVEGLFFSGSFCSIFWLKKRGMMKGLCFANELISRDEGLHTEYAIYLYKTYCDKLDETEIHDMFTESVEIEKEFICESLPCRLIGMNSILMSQYIEFVADRLLVQLGYNKIWNTKNPFNFMESISIESKTNFFEKRNSEYSLSDKKNKDKAFDFVCEF